MFHKFSIDTSELGHAWFFASIWIPTNVYENHVEKKQTGRRVNEAKGKIKLSSSLHITHPSNMVPFSLPPRTRASLQSSFPNSYAVAPTKQSYRLIAVAITNFFSLFISVNLPEGIPADGISLPSQMP